MTGLFSVRTNFKKELIDITDNLQKIVNKLNLREGILFIFVKHTTCAVIITEFEDNLKEDILDFLEKEIPQGSFRHNHAGQSHTPSHILSSTIGQSIFVPISNHKMSLGTWQRICLLELDGPRQREIMTVVLK